MGGVDWCNLVGVKSVRVTMQPLVTHDSTMGMTYGLRARWESKGSDSLPPFTLYPLSPFLFSLFLLPAFFFLIIGFFI